MIYYICDRLDKDKCQGGHCLNFCYHGKPHKIDGCSKDYKCNIDCGKLKEDTFEHDGDESCKKSIIVRCRPANKNELQTWGLI